MTGAATDYALLTLDELNSSVHIDPLNAALHHMLSTRQHEHGDELAALAHLIAARAIEALDTENHAGAAWNLYMVATGYFMKGDYAVSENWYRLVQMLDDQIAEVYQNMVVIHEHFGRFEQAEACRAEAYRLQRVFIDPIQDPIRQLLILCVGSTNGNTPWEVLLSAGKSSRIKYIVDYATDVDDTLLPHYDLVFNAIGEPDVAMPLMPRLEQFLKTCTRPVMNHPALVLHTRRHLLPVLTTGIPDVQVAPCCRLEAGQTSREMLVEALQAGQINFPVLLRPTESHGGVGLVKCDNLELLLERRQQIPGACYISNFVNFVSDDGYYRKYRIVFVDRKPYPYHLAIASDWMVHYYTADMLEHPWKIAEEQRFLQDTAEVLGARAMAAVCQLGNRLDLEYAGIDFTILPNGQVFVFEANATMLVHRVNQSGVLAHKNASVQNIADAFERMQMRFEHCI